MRQLSTARTKARIKREIEALKKLPDSKIDTSEIRVLPPEAWEKAVRGKFYRPKATRIVE